MLRRWIGGWLVMCICTAAVQASPVKIFTYPVPGMIEQGERGVAGPGIETLAAVFEHLNIDVEFEMQPFARVLQSAATTPNTCSFPSDWSSKREQQLSFKLLVAPVDATLYALPGYQSPPEQLSKAQIVTLNNFAANPLLDGKGARLFKVSEPATAMRMLAIGRSDLMFMDAPMARVLSVKMQQPLQVVSTLYRGEAWLACHPQSLALDPQALQATFNELVKGQQISLLWQKAGLYEIYEYLWGAQGTFWRRMEKTEAR